ncbi:hypothetical protein B5X24_HaOG201841 [Helicoverpa armigera]|nr:hypothetical protein B5X24_HaOG201841 [Helicoverpa armigera]
MTNILHQAIFITAPFWQNFVPENVRSSLRINLLGRDLHLLSTTLNQLALNDLDAFFLYTTTYCIIGLGRQTF